MEDYKQAALTLFPTDWVRLDDDFKIDNNAGKRAIAEEVFRFVFDKLKTERVASVVSEAFLRRAEKYGADNQGINTANMSTALMAAIIAIRDGDE